MDVVTVVASSSVDINDLVGGSVDNVELSGVGSSSDGYDGGDEDGDVECKLHFRLFCVFQDPPL